MRTCALTMLASLTSVLLYAQVPIEPPAAPATPVEPRVVSVFNVTKGANAAADKTMSELKDVLKIKVRNLDSWRVANATRPLHLVLAGMELKNVVTVPTVKDAGDPPEISALRVSLDVDNDQEGVNRRAWVQVLQAAYKRPDIDLTVGPNDGTPFPFEPEARIRLHVFPWYTWAVVAFLAVVTLIVVVLGKRSNLLRDSNGSANPPYSLAKHQMAVWFVVVVGSYLYVWLITGLFSSISTTALILIGISGATGLASVTMDSSKRQDAVTTRNALEAERVALQQALNDPATGLQTQLRAAAAGSAEATQLMATITPKLTRLQELVGILNAPAPAPGNNRQWYLDLLSDDTGVSFHRLQMAIWTLVLAIIFIRAVYADILMPDFDATLLGLLGISSGTYLGFKFPEQKS